MASMASMAMLAYNGLDGIAGIKVYYILRYTVGSTQVCYNIIRYTYADTTLYCRPRGPRWPCLVVQALITYVKVHGAAYIGLAGLAGLAVSCWLSLASLAFYMSLAGLAIFANII